MVSNPNHFIVQADVNQSNLANPELISSLQLDSSSYLNRIDSEKSAANINSYPELLQAESNLRDAINLFDKCAVSNNEIPFLQVSNYKHYYLPKSQTLNNQFSNLKSNYSNVLLNKEDSIEAELDKLCEKLHEMKASGNMQTENFSCPISPDHQAPSDMKLRNYDQFELRSKIILPRTIITKTAENEFQLSKLVISPPSVESTTLIQEQKEAINEFHKATDEVRKIVNCPQTQSNQPVIKSNSCQQTLWSDYLPISNVSQNYQKSITLDTEKYQQLMSQNHQQYSNMFTNNNNVTNNSQCYQMPRQYSSLPIMNENTFDDKFGQKKGNNAVYSQLMELINYNIQNKNSNTNNMAASVNAMPAVDNKTCEQTSTICKNAEGWLLRRSMSLGHIDPKVFASNNGQNQFNIKSIQALNSNNQMQSYYPLSNNVSIIEHSSPLNSGSAKLVQYLKPPIPPCLPSIKEKKLRQRELHQTTNINPDSKLSFLLSTTNNSSTTLYSSPNRCLESIGSNNAISSKQILSNSTQSSLDNSSLSSVDNKNVNSFQSNQMMKIPVTFPQQMQQFQNSAQQQYPQTQPTQLSNDSGLLVAISSSASSSPTEMLGTGNKSLYQLFGQNDYLCPYSECRPENMHNNNISVGSCDGGASISGRTGAGDSSGSFGSSSFNNIDGLGNYNQILARSDNSFAPQYDILESQQNNFQAKEMEQIFSQCQYDIDTLLAHLEEVHEKRISKFASTNSVSRESNNHQASINSSSLNAKESLIIESRNFVISSKLFVKCAMERSFQLINYLTECVALLERMFIITENFIMLEVNSPAQISCLVDRLKEVAVTYAYTVDVVRRLVSYSNNEKINPYLDLLMSHATSLATSLTALMRTLRSMN